MTEPNPQSEAVPEAVPEGEPAGPEGSFAGGEIDPDVAAVEGILNFDPFASTGEEPPEGEPAPPPEPVEAQPDPAPDPAEEPPASQTPEAGDELTQTLHGIQELLRSQQAPAPAPEAPDPTLFDVEIPDQLMGLLGSEDPVERKAGVTTLANGVARLVMTRVVEQVGQLQETLPQMVSQQQQRVAYQQNIFRDFYHKYPALNNTALYPVVIQEARKMLEGGYKGWDDRFRDDLGTRVTNLVKGFATPPNGAPAPKRPSYTAPTSARPSTPQSEMEVQDIADTLFGN